MCSVQLLLAWLLVGTVVTFGYNASHLMVDFPKPHSKNNRVLAMMLSYNLNHFDPFILNLNEYLTMCEAGIILLLIMDSPIFYCKLSRMECLSSHFYYSSVEFLLSSIHAEKNLLL